MLALVGFGKWGLNHARVMQDLGLLSAIVDPSPTAKEKAAELFPSIPFMPTIDTLPSNVEGVVVATPIVTHHDVVRGCLDAGFHVLCEKPLTLTITDALDIKQCAEERKLVVNTGYTFLYDPGIITIRAMLERHPLVFANSIRESTVLGEGVGVLHDTMPHDIAIAHYISSSSSVPSPWSIDAFHGSWERDGTLSSGWLQLVGRDDQRFSAFTTWRSPRKFRQILVIAEGLEMVWTMGSKTLELWTNGKAHSLELHDSLSPLHRQTQAFVAHFTKGEEAKGNIDFSLAVQWLLADVESELL